MRTIQGKKTYISIKKVKFFLMQFTIRRKEIFNALKNSNSDSVIKFKEVLKKIVDGK